MNNPLSLELLAIIIANKQSINIEAKWSYLAGYMRAAASRGETRMDQSTKGWSDLERTYIIKRCDYEGIQMDYHKEGIATFSWGEYEF